MKVYIPAAVLNDNWTGVQFYTAQLIDHLSRLPDVLVTAWCNRDAARRLSTQTEGRVRCESTTGGGCRGYDIIHLPTVHFPWHGRPKGSKVVMTFHDLVPLTMPHTHQLHYRVYFRWVLPRVARWLDAAIAVSDSTARDVARFYRVAPQRLHVTGQGCRYEGDAPVVEGAGRERFVLAVGTLEPRKNIRRVIEAFLALDDSSVRLVIAGGSGWGDGGDERLIAQHRNRIDWRGYVNTDDLRDLYRRASMLVYPSLYEGFGLPVLEAMTLGCPVITSNGSSLPQVGGDAAMYVDPTNVAAITTAMRDLLSDESRRQAMAQRGVEQAKQWTWPKCAERTVGVYRKLLER